jgi:hypothetical protein
MGMVNMNRVYEIILFCFVIFLLILLFDFLKEAQKIQNSHIGKKVIVNCDTLIVTGYSYRGYELSNGAACDLEYLKQFMIYGD